MYNTYMYNTYMLYGLIEYKLIMIFVIGRADAHSVHFKLCTQIDVNMLIKI